MKINFSGHEFILHHLGGLYWPSERLLIVSDLHLEKGSHFAKRGFFLPPYDSADTLRTLHDMCALYGPERVMLLGDSFHDARGYERMSEIGRHLFSELGKYDPIWIRGNHDGDFVPEGFEICDEKTMSGIRFCHEATDGEGAEISGHFHPKAEIIYKGSRISRRCFVEDGHRLIMPAMGSYTGGLLVSDPAIGIHFKAEMRLHLLGQSRIFSVRLADINAG